VSARLKLAGIFLVCAAPFVLGWLAYEYRWFAGAAGNYGELIPPRPLAGPLAPLRGKWVLVTLDRAACDPACEKKLYTVRLGLLRDAGRPAPQLLAALEDAHVAAADAELVKAFPGDPLAHVYLVDPLGNLMMRFPAGPEPSKVIKDLQRLLKYSRFG
jgi:hypothetical protein